MELERLPVRFEGRADDLPGECAAESREEGVNEFLVPTIRPQTSIEPSDLRPKGMPLRLPPRREDWSQVLGEVTDIGGICAGIAGSDQRMVSRTMRREHD